LCCVLDHLVFPNTDDSPSRFSQYRCRLGVSGSISLDLGRPKLAVRGRWSVVLGTAVPVATVNENRYTRAREHEIRGAPQLGQRTLGHPVSQAHGMEARS
jgi:hypothetical protein